MPFSIWRKGVRRAAIRHRDKSSSVARVQEDEGDRARHVHLQERLEETKAEARPQRLEDQVEVGAAYGGCPHPAVEGRALVGASPALGTPKRRPCEECFAIA